jgi:hypothetical protein
MMSELILPDVYTTPGGGVLQAYSPKDIERYDALRRAQYFLVVNGGADAPARCRQCGRKHMYLTRACVEQPFRGLRGALYRYAKVTRDSALTSRLRRLPDLASRHPQMAHSLQPDEEGEDVIAFQLGVAEPITEAKAQQLVEALKQRRVRPPYILEE